MTGNLADLEPNGNLIDAGFDGYKLSLDPLATYQVDIESAVDDVTLTENQYSYQHVKSFGKHNHLVVDPWNPHLVFFVDDQWKVRKFTVLSETSLETPVTVFDIPEAACRRQIAERLNVSLHFPAADWLVLGDGAGHLHLIATADRTHNDQWLVRYSGAVLPSDRPFIVLDSVLCGSGDDVHIDCLLLHVEMDGRKEAEGDANRTPSFITHLTWLSLMPGDGKDWTLTRTRTLTSSSSPDYAVLEASGQGIVVSSDKPFKLVFDSQSSPQTAATGTTQEQETDREDATVPAYTWNQTAEDIAAQFTLPSGVSKADIVFRLTTDAVELAVKNGETLLKGDLHRCVEPDSCTWTVQERRLELTLTKAQPAMWPLVVCGDTRGEMVLDSEQVAHIHERLAHLTSDTWNPDPGESVKPPYNAQQLEDCDMFPPDSAVLQRVDGTSHEVTHQVNLGSHQWMFNCRSDGDKRQHCLCLRHDVDGLIWQPTNESAAPWQHVATFSALGYVLAGKRDKKFATCAPDFSYAAVCDCVRHVYVYWQPAPVLSPLRNRKTGREVSTVAKQQLISVRSVDPIMGLQATNERMFILAGKILYVIRMTTPECVS